VQLPDIKGLGAFVVGVQHVEAILMAFCKACEALQLDVGGILADTVAEKIINLAMAGETDPERLYADALRGLLQ
jgi:hypothetical protein